MKAFGYDTADFIPSEISGAPAVDINHIFCKGMGGNPSGDKDVIENLIALTREEHIKYGDKVEYYEFLIRTHIRFMKKHGVYPTAIWNAQQNLKKVTPHL